MDVFLFLGIVFLMTFVIGKILERFSIPWIFAALIIGVFLADFPVQQETFNFLANLGMYLLLFIIGFQIDLTKLAKSSKFIVKSTFFIILFEAFFGSLIIHFLFGYNWILSVIVSLSFATVGEAILLPILDEFNIVNTKLGHSIIGVGTLDDVIEVIALIAVMVLVGSSTNLIYVGASLAILFIMAFGLTKLREEVRYFKFLDLDELFLFSLFVIFLFIGLGNIADAAPIGAILAGIALKTFIPDKRLEKVETLFKTVCYGLFAPIFFLWVGMSVDVKYILAYPLLVLIVSLVSIVAKLVASWISGHNVLGFKSSLLFGVGLSVRFSTSLVIVKILLDNNLITTGLYSVIVASSVIFTFIIPFTFSYLVKHWRADIH